MCPLRLILIFLSATLAGFFVLKKLNSTTDEDPLDDSFTDADSSDADADSKFTKVRMSIKSGFWTCVDMASGRYLWNHLSSHSKQSSS
ncbi:unnamed protein product [Cochlearia groenlandica]